MRGTLSMAMTVAPLRVSFSSNSVFWAGHRKLISVCPARRRDASSSSGARTFITMSAPDQRSSAESTTSHPAARYASSEKLDSTPAPASTDTSKPSLINCPATSGVVATRRSPGKFSLGTPIFIRTPPFGLRQCNEGLEWVKGAVNTNAGAAQASSRGSFCNSGECVPVDGSLAYDTEKPAVPAFISLDSVTRSSTLSLLLLTPVRVCGRLCLERIMPTL